MQDLTVRSATTADASSISELIQRTVRVSNAPDYDLAAIEAICGEFTPDKVLRDMAKRDVFVAILEPSIVGTISLGGERLHSLFVAPDLQGQGIGATLVAHIENHALDKGLSTLRVSSSITARPFYEELGFRTLVFRQQAPFSTFLMCKDITPS